MIALTWISKKKLVAILAIALCLNGCEQKKFVSIGTGGTGGVYYPYGGGVAEIWSKYVDGVTAVAEVTGASVENTKLCHRGETLFGEVMSDVAYQAYHGTGRFEGDPQNIRAMFIMYPNVYQAVTLKGNKISSLNDLKGRKVSVGSPGSGTELMTSLVLGEALGISYDQFDVFRLSFTEASNALKDGSIDAGIWVVAPPTSSIMDLATTHDIQLIPFSTQEMDGVLARHPYYGSFTMPANIYKGQTESVLAPYVWNLFICNADVDDGFVYELTKAVFDHQEELVSIHPYAKYTTPHNAVEHAAIPLHPGALRYLREQGLEIPLELLSP